MHLSQVHQQSSSGTSNSVGAVLRGCTCPKCTNKAEVPSVLLVQLRQLHPLASTPPQSNYLTLFTLPQPHHAPPHLPQPSFRHPHSVWSLASLVSARGGAVHHLSSCRLAPADQAAGTGTHARGIRTTRDE